MSIKHLYLSDITQIITVRDVEVLCKEVLCTESRSRQIEYIYLVFFLHNPQSHKVKISQENYVQ